MSRTSGNCARKLSVFNIAICVRAFDIDEFDISDFAHRRIARCSAPFGNGYINGVPVDGPPMSYFNNSLGVRVFSNLNNNLREAIGN